MIPNNTNNLKLIYYPNQILRTVCEKIPDEFFNTSILKNLCAKMKEIADNHDGIGIAAPQLGVPVRIIYITPNKKNRFIIINPKIIEVSSRKILESEGCLSLPEIYGTVIRPEKIIVQGYDENGELFEINADELVSRIIQHEIDHLDGILFIDKAVKITSGEQRLKELNAKK